jgi:hypothetical protein
VLLASVMFTVGAQRLVAVDGPYTYFRSDARLQVEVGPLPNRLDVLESLTWRVPLTRAALSTSGRAKSTFTRAASSTGRRAKSDFLSITSRARDHCGAAAS